jgi:hypothetical protein
MMQGAMERVNRYPRAGGYPGWPSGVESDGGPRAAVTPCPAPLAMSLPMPHRATGGSGTEPGPPGRARPSAAMT